MPASAFRVSFSMPTSTSHPPKQSQPLLTRGPLVSIECYPTPGGKGRQAHAQLQRVLPSGTGPNDPPTHPGCRPPAPDKGHLLQRSGRLQPGLSHSDALAVLWAMTGTDFYSLLVFQRGWTPSRYEDWLGTALISLLLVPAKRVKPPTMPPRSRKR